jgi:arabinan endo-1,5-alpha-L-arabinosidase
VRVGRSREITGPYLDKGGVDMKEGGGTLVLDTEEEFIGPGHPAIFRDGERYLMSYHYYDRDRNGRSALAIRELNWTDDGWPRVASERITPAAE